MSITVFLESNSGPYPEPDVAYSNALDFYGEGLLLLVQPQSWKMIAFYKPAAKSSWQSRWRRHVTAWI
jgi:hypothetical protein